MKNKYNKICYTLVFSVPAVMVLVLYAIFHVAPFGPKSLCTMDAFAQYYPMLENMWEAIRKGELFYSFSGGLGFNLWSQSAYYTNSPLWLLLFVLPKSTHLALIDLTAVLRFSLSSLFFCFYLNSHTKISRQRILPYLALSVAYAFSGWAVAFENQFMWTDCMMLLPLVIMGIERLFDGKSPVLYTISLFLCIWSCFYIAYMVCIFAVIWMLKLLLEQKRSLKDRAVKTGRFAVCSALSGGAAAVSLLPLLHSISLTKATGIGLESARKYGSILDLLLNMLPFRSASLEYGAPNIYCTVTAILLAGIMLFCSIIPRRKKIVNVCIWVFLILSFKVNVLYYIWHGFHFPNQLPGRFSFVYIFFMLVCASSYVEHKAFEKVFAGSIQPKMRKIATVFFTIMLIEGLLGMHLRTTNADGSILKFSDIGKEFSSLASSDEQFSRQELTPLKSNNQGLQYGYNGIGWYSSTMSGAQYDFFQKLGLEKYAKNVSTYYESDSILDAIFSVKYIAESQTGKIKENKNVLPLAFLADNSLAEFDIDGYEQPEDIRNSLWFSLCGETLSVKNGVEKLNECPLEITSFRSDRIKGTVSCNKDGILFTSIPDDGGWSVYIDGKKVETSLVGKLLLSCRINKGEHTVELRYIPPLFTAGAVISAASVVAAVVFFCFYKRKSTKKKKALDTI